MDDPLLYKGKVAFFEFVSLLADASDGFPKESSKGKRRLNKKRRHRAAADRFGRKSGHSKKRTMTNNDRKVPLYTNNF